MELFNLIEDGIAIIRMPKGVHKQVKVYQRGERVFVPHGGGFIRVCASFGDVFGTSHPDVKVLELEAPGVDVSSREPRFVAPLKAAA